MSGFRQDLRYAARMLWKSPGFTAVAVLALAFGIGANSAIFTLLNAMALRPLPLRDANQVVTVYQITRGLKSRNVHGSTSYLSYPEYLSYRDQNHVFSGLAAYAAAPLTLGGPNARPLQGHLVTCNYFEVLSEPLIIGRGFLPEECGAPGRNPVAVLSYTLWRNRFNSDPGISGKTLVLNHDTFTIVGVAPRNFSGASLTSADVWAPLSMQPQWMPGREFLPEANLSWLEVSGRLKPGIGLSTARADLAVIVGRIDQLTPGRKTTLAVDRATLMNNPEGRTPVLAVGAVVLAGVSLVLLIACANLANLLLARAAVRHKEIAVRLAVGATRLRLIRQLLTESLMLAFAGGALGLLAGSWTLRAVYPVVLSKLPPEASLNVINLGLDVRILLYSLAVSFVTGIAFGLLPATQASRLDLSSELKGGGGMAHGRQGRLRGALVTAQVAVCLVLLITAGLLARGLLAAQTVDPGFDMKDVTVASFDLRLQGYDPARAALFHRQLRDRLAATPGVEAIAATQVVPLSGARHGSLMSIEGGEAAQLVTFATVSENYFSLLRIPIVQGRGFELRDMQAGSRVAIVNQSTARRFWPNQDPVGRRVQFGSERLSLEIAGVAKDIHHSRLSQTDSVFLYLPATPKDQVGLNVLVRGTGSLTLAQAIRDAAKTIDARVLVQTSRLEDNLQRWVLPAQITAGLSFGLGLVGLMLAALGIYGVMSYAVTQRTREIGIRMTLGAERIDVMRLILRQAFRPVALGVTLGLVGCAAVSRVLSSLLFGVSPLDPLVFTSVAVFLGVVALMASFVPARRATRVDPMAALRQG